MTTRRSAAVVALVLAAVISLEELSQSFIPARRLDVELTDEELARRRADWQPVRRELTGWLKRYAAMVTSGSQGAVLAV